MKMSGCSREDTVDDDGHEIQRDEWDMKIPNDEDERIFYVDRKYARGEAREVDWERTPWETLRERVASNETFPAYLGGRE